MRIDLTLSIAGRILLAAFLGGIIGLEREIRRKPAGLRTNMFICVGSALFTILSAELAKIFGGEPVRIAAQLIPGIGFIGAGSILHARGSVVGLTTAATIFVIASIGMAVGGGMYLTGIFTTFFLLFALWALGRFERRFDLKTQTMSYNVTCQNIEEGMSGINATLESRKLALQNLRVQRVGKEYVVEFEADVTDSQHRELMKQIERMEATSEPGSPRGSAKD
ncbi:MAG TPA: MgtC/SapB family protein [Candidatus Acidoferrales bacterium]